MLIFFKKGHSFRGKARQKVVFQIQGLKFNYILCWLSFRLHFECYSVQYFVSYQLIILNSFKQISLIYLILTVHFLFCFKHLTETEKTIVGLNDWSKIQDCFVLNKTVWACCFYIPSQQIPLRMTVFISLTISIPPLSSKRNLLPYESTLFEETVISEIHYSDSENSAPRYPIP